MPYPNEFETGRNNAAILEFVKVKSCGSVIPDPDLASGGVYQYCQTLLCALGASSRDGRHNRFVVFFDHTWHPFW